MIFFTKLSSKAEIIVDNTQQSIPFSNSAQMYSFDTVTNSLRGFYFTKNVPIELLSISVIPSGGYILYDPAMVEIGFVSPFTTISYPAIISLSPAEIAISQDFRMIDIGANLFCAIDGALSMVGVPDTENGKTISVDVILKFNVDGRAVIWQ